MKHNKKLDTIMNLLCRICGQETKNVIPIFGESGKIHNISKKIRACLSFLTVDKADHYPKQVCLDCMSKLDASWDLYNKCQEGQKRLDTKMQQIQHAQDVDMSTIIEERIKSLSETQPVSIGESTIITLAPASPPPPTATPTLPQPPLAPAPAPALPQPPQVQAGEGQGETPARKRIRPMPAPAPTTVGSPNNRRRVGVGRRAGGGRLKLCKFCRKLFPDDIIDHHIDLHLRRSFFTCLDCNKNFRSEDAMSRHRCAAPRPPPPPPPPIDLDADSDDQPICL